MADTASTPHRERPSPARRRFTTDDVERLMHAGVIEEGGPEELLDGDIWIMPAEGSRHSRLKVWLNDELVRRRPQTARIACDTTIRFSADHNPSPDFAVFPRSLNVDEARGPDLLLVIEIADSSIRDDLAVKGPKYLEYGVREYWVIDAVARVTHVHFLDGAWPVEPPTSWDTPLCPRLLPELSLRMADHETA